MYEFRVDDVNLNGIDWKSPLQLKFNDVCEKAGRAAAKAFDDMVFEAVTEVGIEVDRAELIKALAYDRDQYDKGYGDGYKAAKDEIVRCRDCKWWDCYGGEESHKGDCLELELDCCMYEEDFCSYGERRDDAENH